ncbi:MAG: response regulator [Desulfobacterales bacterium]
MNRWERENPIRILLVEDSEHDQFAFKRAMMKSNVPFELTVCRRGEDIAGAMQAGSDSFDLVVIDYNLPGINGLEAFRLLRQQTDLPPFVMLTGTGSESLAVDALKAGMYDYIIKDPHQGYLRLLPLKLKDVQQRHRDRILRMEAKADLERTHAALEKMVEERTADLAMTIEALEREIAERKLTEKALRNSERALRSLSYKIVQTQENERKQMAKELHDSIGSSLAAIKFAVEEKLHSMRSSPPKDIISLEKIISHIQDTIKEVRRISTSLRPSMLDDLGLIPTIQWYCRTRAEIYKNTRIETRFDVEESLIPAFGKIVIYRVLQEAVNNALKHSGAGTVRVIMLKENDGICMCVEDDGCGFDQEWAMESTDPLSGYGLKAMRDRAEVVGGLLAIDSSPGRGTVVRLQLPCQFTDTP